MLKLAFPDVVPVERPNVELAQTIDPNWLAGFTSAEGCFHIGIAKSQTKVGYKVQLVFLLSQHVWEKPLMGLIKYTLGCGNLYVKREALELIVTKFSDIENKIIPFFKKYKIRDSKLWIFKIYVEQLSWWKKRSIWLKKV